MEQDDAKIAESWWSGTAGSAETPGEPPRSEEAADWESLRQKFVSTHDAQPPAKRSRPGAVRGLLLLLAAMFLLIAGGAIFVLVGGAGVPAQIRTTIDALLEQQPPQTPAVEEAASSTSSQKKKPSRRAPAAAPSFPPVVAETTVAEQTPFTIEVIDRNRRTMLRSYEQPLQLSIDDVPVSTAIGPEAPSLVIEETIGPGGAVSTTTNVGASVVLSGIVTTSGQMRDLRVVRGPVEFVPAAMEAVRRWRFEVQQQAGIPVERPAWVTVNMAIRSDGAPARR